MMLCTGARTALHSHFILCTVSARRQVKKTKPGTSVKKSPPTLNNPDDLDPTRGDAERVVYVIREYLQYYV